MKTVTFQYLRPRVLPTSFKSPLTTKLALLLLLVSTATPVTWANEVAEISVPSPKLNATDSQVAILPSDESSTVKALPNVIKNLSSDVTTPQPPPVPVSKNVSATTVLPEVPPQVSNIPPAASTPSTPAEDGTTNATETTEKDPEDTTTEANTSETGEPEDANATTIFVTPFPPESTTSSPASTTAPPLDPKAELKPQTPTWSVVLMVMLAVASLVLTAMFLIRRHYARKRKEERRFLLSEGYFFGENNQL